MIREDGQPDNDLCPFETDARHQANHGSLTGGSWTNLEANIMRQAQGHFPDGDPIPCSRYANGPVAFLARVHALRSPKPEKEPA